MSWRPRRGTSMVAEGDGWRSLTDPTLLMHVSTATANPHRIHYDWPTPPGSRAIRVSSCMVLPPPWCSPRRSGWPTPTAAYAAYPAYAAYAAYGIATPRRCSAAPRRRPDGTALAGLTVDLPPITPERHQP